MTGFGPTKIARTSSSVAHRFIGYWNNRGERGLVTTDGHVVPLKAVRVTLRNPNPHFLTKVLPEFDWPHRGDDNGRSGDCRWRAVRSRRRLRGGWPWGQSVGFGASGRGRWLVADDRVRGQPFRRRSAPVLHQNQEVHRLFVETVAEDLLKVPRLTRIFYNNKYFNYPLTPLNALFGVGLSSGLSILSSYTVTRARRALGGRPVESFEDWVVDQFGRRLFETFFKTYTEKVWGIPCTQIGADWARQRIKGLSLTTALINALFKPKTKVIKTLIDEFIYPRLGAGQLYEKMAANVMHSGSRVVTGARVSRIWRDDLNVTAVEVNDASGQRYAVEGRQFLVSAPLTDMIEMMSPQPPPRFWQHAARCAIAITSGLTSSSRDVRFRTSGSMSTRRRWAWHAFRITPTSHPRWPPGPVLVR